MTCPYCRVEYTWDEPCFCQPRVQRNTTQAEDPLAAREERQVLALAPTGLDNPVWKA